MAKTSNIDSLTATEIAALIKRVEHAIEHDLALTLEDLKCLLLAITTLCTLQQKMEQDNITLHKLRKLLGMVKQSEQRSKTSGKNKKPPNSNKKSNKNDKKKVTIQLCLADSLIFS